jgi:hypothetical protein
MAMAKLPTVASMSSQCRFRPTPQARFLAVSLRHTTIKDEDQYNSQDRVHASPCFYKHPSLTMQDVCEPCDVSHHQTLQCKLPMSLAM